MLRFISPGVFATAFSAAYTVLAIVDWTPFLYYPQINRITTVTLLDAAGKLDRKAGPSMHWYGWITVSILIAIVVSLVIPRRWTKPIEPYLAWVPALIAVIAILIFERRWLV
jgi:hypothetical protein